MLISGKGKRVKKPEKKQVEHSKYITDIRALLWVVTLGALVLAAYAIHKEFLGALPWISALVALPWSAHGVVAGFYLNMAKSDHKEGGITFEKAKANNFQSSEHSTPPI